MHACICGCVREGYQQQNVKKKKKKKIHLVIVKAAFTPLRHSLYTHTTYSTSLKSTTERGEHRETGSEIERASKATFVAP